MDKTFYQENGYLKLNNFFDKEEIQKVHNDAKLVFYYQFLEKGYTQKVFEVLDEKEFNSFLFRLFNEDLECLSNCGKQAQHLISLHRLSLGEKLIDTLKELGIFFPNISTRPVLYFNHPNLAKQKVFYKVDAHQDWRSMQGSLNSLVVWVPLIDITKDLGALQIIPKSHLFGLRTNHIDNGFGMVKLSENENDKFISVEVEAGDILIFSSFLIHQSGENITDSPRWSCHFRYNDLKEPSFVARKFAHPYIYRPIENLITKDFPNPDQVLKIFKKVE